jgi:hypothetical protein
VAGDGRRERHSCRHAPKLRAGGGGGASAKGMVRQGRCRRGRQGRSGGEEGVE